MTQGDIVIIAGLVAPQGRNPQDRACVIISLPGKTAAVGVTDVVAITSLIPAPIPFDHVALPWPPQRDHRTGLNKRNAAACTWNVEVEESRSIRKIGYVLGKQLLQIASGLRVILGVD